MLSIFTRRVAAGLLGALVLWGAGALPASAKGKAAKSKAKPKVTVSDLNLGSPFVGLDTAVEDKAELQEDQEMMRLLMGGRKLETKVITANENQGEVNLYLAEAGEQLKTLKESLGASRAMLKSARKQKLVVTVNLLESHVLALRDLVGLAREMESELKRRIELDYPFEEIYQQRKRLRNVADRAKVIYEDGKRQFEATIGTDVPLTFQAELEPGDELIVVDPEGESAARLREAAPPAPGTLVVEAPAAKVRYVRPRNEEGPGVGEAEHAAEAAVEDIFAPPAPAPTPAESEPAPPGPSAPGATPAATPAAAPVAAPAALPAAELAPNSSGVEALPDE